MTSFTEVFTNMLIGEGSDDVKRQIRKKRAEIRIQERHIEREIERFEDEERDLKRDAIKCANKSEYNNAKHIARQIDLNRRQKEQLCKAMFQLKQISNDLRKIRNQHTLQTSMATVTEILREINAGGSIDGVRSLRDFQYQREVSENRREHLDDVMDDALDDDSLDVDAEDRACDILTDLGVVLPRDGSDDVSFSYNRSDGSSSSAYATSSTAAHTLTGSPVPLVDGSSSEQRHSRASSGALRTGGTNDSARHRRAPLRTYKFDDPSLQVLEERLKKLNR